MDIRNILYSQTHTDNGIQRVSLGQLTIEEPCYGTSATAIVRTSEEQPKYIRITDFNDFGIEEKHVFKTAETFSNKHFLKFNDLLFARSGSVGKTYFYDGSIGQAVFAGYCIRFRFDENKVIPKYVYWYTKTNSFLRWVDGIQRPAVQPNINKEEYKSFEILLPCLEDQKKLVDFMDKAFLSRQKRIKQTDEIFNHAKIKFFETFGLSLVEYAPALYSVSNRGKLREMGIYCNPHSDYLNTVFLHLRENEYYAGNLEDFVEINPTTNRAELQDNTPVAFVPMPAVEEKTNGVSYEIKPYKEVKTGFTIFQKNDLLWAKITPCMQNGKSFIAADMPTEIGFGSTEFHVLRKKSERIYMPYLWVILSDAHILEAAQGMFSGSAGQQRVPDTFLKKFPIVLPPVEIQKELADNVMRALKQAKEMRDTAETEWQSAKEQFERELLQ
ncbi:MAG: restriction endonuclease subunit S [Clostridia bacterium]|nr:restriction endonuclease subunit S [Clostridia bacterium]